MAYLTVYDTRGRLMIKKDLSLNRSLLYKVNTQALSKGIYFIKIHTAKGFTFVKKLVKG
jgi:hypothetical protein